MMQSVIVTEILMEWNSDVCVDSVDSDITLWVGSNCYTGRKARSGNHPLCIGNTEMFEDTKKVSTHNFGELVLTFR